MPQFTDFASSRAKVNGVELHVRHAGSGPCVLLMHGWCGSSHSWRHVGPLLAEDYLVIAPDMRGYGSSDKPEEGYDASEGARDMIGLLDVFGVDRAHVVGFDMGAPVALVFGAEHANRTSSVAYIDEPLLGFDTERYTAFTDWNHGGYWQFGLHNTPGMSDLLYPGREEEILTLLYSHMTVNKSAMSADDVREHARGMKMQDGIRGMTGWYRAALRTGEQVRAAIGKVPSPAIAIRGEGGVVGILEEIRQAIPDAYGEIVPNCGHLVPEERPHELVAILRQHFARQAQATGA